MEPALPNSLATAARWYREELAWPVVTADDEMILPLGRGVVAFDVPWERASLVLECMDRTRNHTPTLLTTDRTMRVTFLADANDLVLGQFQMPAGVLYLSAPSAVQLPPPPGTLQRTRKRWLRPPDPGARWLSSAAAVLSAITGSTPRPDVARLRPLITRAGR